MPRYNDPQEVHGTECVHCLAWQFDSERDIAPSGRCWTCEDEHDNADEQLKEDDVLTLRPDWLEIARQIVIPRRENAS